MIFNLDVDRKTERKALVLLDDFIREVATEFSNELKIEAPVYRGTLRQSIQVLNAGLGGYTVAIQVPYALPVQQGTEAHTPELEPLLKWAERKLGSRQAGYGVFHKIKREGTDANPYVTRALKNLEEKYR